MLNSSSLRCLLCVSLSLFLPLLIVAVIVMSVRSASDEYDMI